MKPIISLLTTFGLLAASLAGLAQTPPASGDAAPAAAAATNTPPAEASPGGAATPAAAPAETPPPGATMTNAPAAETPPGAATTSTNMPAAETPAGGATMTNPPAGEAAAGAPAPGEAAAAPGAVIPLIVMDDVKLTDAIKNLARQAGLNYMLDPRVAFGQMGPNNVPIPEPSVSIRWVNVTAEQALYALLNNYSLQLVEDPKSHIARISPRDPAAPDPLVTKIYQLKFAGPTNVVPSIQSTLSDKRSKVVADVRSSQIVVVATEKELADVDKLVERLDTQTKQVLIEARLLETSLNPKTFKGIDWSGTLLAQNIHYGNGTLNPAASSSTTTIPGAPQTGNTFPNGKPAPTTTPNHDSTTILSSILGNGGLTYSTAAGLTPNIGFLNADGVNAVLSFINQDAEAKIISAPRTVTLDNEPAHISVTTARPVINVTASTVQTTGGSSITYSNLGVILDVTPRISANNFVNLRVVPEVSRFSDTVTKVINGQAFQADEFDFRRVTTTVMIPSGNTLVLGGLVQDNLQNQTTKVPVLGDVPVLGFAFRSEAKQRIKSNLVIFITPTIVQDEDYQPTLTDFLKTPVPESLPEKEWSAWDSTKPMDWSKPVSQ